MWVTISGTQYFSGDTWTDAKAETWATLAGSYTWGELLNPHDGLVLTQPEPAIRDIVEDRSTADFAILDTAHAFSFTKGEYVEILDFDLNPMFNGFIETAIETRISPDGIIMHQITATDNHYLADKRLIAKGFDGATYPTVADIVTYIIDNILDDEGVTVGAINATAVVEAVTFDYRRVSEALDELAQFAGCTWYIDFDKALYFVPRSTYSSAWNITEVANVMDDVLSGTFTKTSSSPEYRNYQYIRGGNAKTDLQTEVFVGDGETTSFPIAYKMFEEPTISISTDSGKTYTAATVGIKGVETGKDWYWSSNDQIITQDFAGTRLTSTGRLKIEYYGIYQIVLTSANFLEIVDRQSVEGGGSGLVEAVKDDPLVTTEAAGIAEANAILDHYAQIGIKVEYTTLRSGIEVGTLQHITSTIHNLDDDFLITQVEKCPMFHDDSMVLNDIVQYRITGVSGPVEDYWTKVFLKLNQGTGAGSLASSTSIVLILKQFTHDWAAIDTPNIWTCAVPDGKSYTVSSLEFPGFDSTTGPTYISMWTTSGPATEVFRKYRTAQTYTAGDKYVTTYYLSSAEANLHWDEIRIYGGEGATSTFGTGVYLYTISSSDYTKSDLEALQIVITDNHW